MSNGRNKSGNGILRFIVTIILVGVVGYALIFYEPNAPTSLPSGILKPIIINTPVIFPTYTPTQIIPTYTPYPTTTPYPTYTPFPTQTPYPTATPYPTPVVYYGEFDYLVRTYSPHIFGIIVFGFLCWIAYLLYDWKIHMVELNHDRDLAWIDANTPPTNTNTQRAIIVNQRGGGGHAQMLITRRDKLVPAEKVREFMLNVAEVGLAVSAWRTKMNWKQCMIEDLLDHLEDIELINPRQNGVAATWRRQVGIDKLAKMLGIELEQEENNNND